MKRMFAAVLTLCLLFSLLPMGSSAANPSGFKRLIRSDSYDADGVLLSYWDCTYDERGERLVSRSVMANFDEEIVNGIATHYYDEDGVLTKIEIRQGMDEWTETYSYEWPNENTCRETKFSTFGNITTVTETRYAADGDVEYESVTENGVTRSVLRVTSKHGVRYEELSYGGDSAEVQLYDEDSGALIGTYHVLDNGDLSVDKETDAHGNIISYTTLYKDEFCEQRTVSSFVDGKIVKSVETREDRFFNNTIICTYDNSGNMLSKERWVNGTIQQKNTWEYDDQGYPIKEVDYDGNLKMTFYRVNTYQTFAAPAEPVFADVPADTYYADAVNWAVERNITNGTSATTFSPDATCTRGQVVTFLWRAKGCPEPTSKTNPFTDVPSNEYYYKAVLWAVEQGITNGTSKTTFSPNDPCTRAHVVTFLWRAENEPAAGSANPFTDVPAGQYYTDAVLWAVSKHITNGTSANTFSPDKPCTRGQIVTFLYRDMK